MSVNKYHAHILILPEDDANRQLANGFHLGIEPSLTRNLQVLAEVGGWTNVRDHFVSDHVFAMEKYPSRLMILLVDFDENENRLNELKKVVPKHLAERVFVLGVFSEPEGLKQANLGSYEEIGSAMAKDCREGTETIWGHDLLRHNADELDRLREHACFIMFG